MQHTYLFEEGIWHTAGTYIDGRGNQSLLTGVSRIIHTPRAWDISGRMTVEGPSPVAFENNYTVTPLTPGQLEAAWTSVNPSLGKLQGQLSVVGDSLLLQWRTENNRSFGMEYLKQIDADHYIDRGTMFAGDVRISSWIADLERTEKTP